MNHSRGLILILIGFAAIGAGGIGVETYEKDEMTYTYTISTERVSEYDKSSVQSVSELKEEERELLKEAFSKSDTFFEGSTTTIERETKVRTELDWDVIEVDGAAVVVSVSEKAEETASSKYTFSMMGIMFGSIGFAIGAGLLFTAKWTNGISSSTSRSIDLRDL